MPFRSPYAFPVFLLVSSLFSLMVAYIAEYGFGLKPCVLCLYQRVPYTVLIGLSLLSLLLMQKEIVRRLLPILALLILLVGAAVAFYHVGVEHKWFAGLDTCSGQGSGVPKTLEEMRAQLLATKAVRCDQPQFVFLGFSMAAWNMLWSLFLAALTAATLWKSKKSE
jgi:disulfide bond formation protein DsbB